MSANYTRGPSIKRGHGALTIEVDLSKALGLFGQEKKQQAICKQWIHNVFLDTAGFLKTKMSEKLDVSGSGNVGATGRAARNLFISSESDTDVIIYTGAYPANYFILHGRPRKAKSPNIDSIVNWLAAKPGINIKRPERQKRWRMTKRGGIRAKGIRKPRPYKADLKSVAYIIGRTIGKSGLVHLRDLPPRGQGRYDYPREALLDNSVVVKAKLSDLSNADRIRTFLRTGVFVSQSRKGA